MDKFEFDYLINKMLAEQRVKVDAEPLAIHKINPVIATEYGEPAALVFEQVSALFKANELKAVEVTHSMLEREHPYLGLSALRYGLDALLQGKGTCPPLVQRRMHGGLFRYTPLSPESPASQLMQYEPHVFETSIAGQVGVVPALMFNRVQRENMIHRNTDLWKHPCKQDKFVRHCVRELPYASKQTFRRAIKALVDAGLLRQRRIGAFRLWTTVEKPPTLN